MSNTPWSPVPGWDVPRDFYAPDEPTADEESFDAMIEERMSMELSDNGHPRRNRTDLHTPAELAICEAVRAVEAAGAHPLLTEAVQLLTWAKNRVADFVELPPKQ